VRLIFLAASILAQPIQRPLSENDLIEKVGPPHFLHLAGAVISRYFMTISYVVGYKEETKHLVLANVHVKESFSTDCRKTVNLRQQKSCWLILCVS